MHRIRKVFTVACLVHWWSTLASSRSLNASSLRGDYLVCSCLLIWANMIDSILMMVLESTILNWGWRVHAVDTLVWTSHCCHATSNNTWVIHLVAGASSDKLAWVSCDMGSSRRRWTRSICSLRLEVVCLMIRRVIIIPTGQIILLSRLWTNSSKMSTKSRTALVGIILIMIIIVIVVVIVIVIAVIIVVVVVIAACIIIAWVSYWASSLIDVWIGIEVDWVCCTVSSMGMLTNIALSKLIKNWSRPFCINCRYLCHHLTIIGMWAVIELCTLSICCLCWTYFTWTCSLMTICVVLASSSSIGCIVVSMTKACGTHLLIIVDSTLFQNLVECHHTFSIASIKSIPSELLNFTIRHLLGFF